MNVDYKLLVIALVVGYYMGKANYNKPVNVTVEQSSDSPPEISPLHLERDSVATRTVIINGDTLTPTTKYYVLSIKPSDFR